MTKRKFITRSPASSSLTFANFIDDPLIGSAILVFALIVLTLSITEFTQVIAYH